MVRDVWRGFWHMHTKASAVVGTRRAARCEYAKAAAVVGTWRPLRHGQAEAAASVGTRRLARKSWYRRGDESCTGVPGVRKPARS